MHRVARVVARLLVGALLLVAGCGDDTGNGPGDANRVEGKWPTEATGMYQRVTEVKESWNILNFDWRYVTTDTVAVCGDPVVSLTAAAWNMGPTIYTTYTMSGEISDTSYYVVVIVTMHGYMERECDFSFTASTLQTGRPPSREGWKIDVLFESVTCGPYYPAVSRYTYTRIGDVECGARD